MGIQLLACPQTPPLPNGDLSRCRACLWGCFAPVHTRAGSWQEWGCLSCPHGPSIMCRDVLKGPCAIPRAEGPPSTARASPGEGRLGCLWVQMGCAMPGRAGEGLKLWGTWSRAKGTQAVKGVSMGTVLEPVLPCWVAHLLHQQAEGPHPVSAGQAGGWHGSVWG